MKPTTEIDADNFKDQCLSLLDELDPQGLVITKHGRPIARVIPYPKGPESLIGSLKGKISIHGDLLSTEVRWKAAVGTTD